MNASPVFRRTHEGQAALDRRDKRIPPRMRALMLVAEGKPLDRFAEFAAALGFGPDSLDELIGYGFVVPVRGEGPTPVSPDLSTSDAANPPVEAVSSAGVAATVDAGMAGRIEGEDVYANFREASGLMREFAGDNMGMKAFFFILKIEKCATLGELGKLVPELVSAVTRRNGRTEAERLARRLYAIIG